MSSIFSTRFYALKLLLMGFLVLAGMLTPLFYSLAIEEIENSYFIKNVFYYFDEIERYLKVQFEVKNNFAISCRRWDDGTDKWINCVGAMPPSTVLSMWDGITAQDTCFNKPISGEYCLGTNYLQFGVSAGWFEEIMNFPGGVYPGTIYSLDFGIGQTYNYYLGGVQGSWKNPNANDFYLHRQLFIDNPDLKPVISYLDRDTYVKFIDFNPDLNPSIIKKLSAFGIEPIITAELPIECSWNKKEDWIFDFKGKIEIPIENPNIYTKFLLRLYVRQPMEMGMNFLDIEFVEFPNLKAGEMWEWNFEDFEIPPHENSYFLTYWLEGYNAETLKPFRWVLMPIDICGKDTILSDKTEFPVGLIPIEWIEMIYEDCTLLTGFEKIMCEFTNWVKSIFAPSKEQLDALNQDLDQIKTKFPFTYISVFTNFVKNVKSGINENKGISFKILGVEGAVNFDFWEESTSFGGITQSFSTIFKGFVMLFISIGFVGGWLIPFIRKIL